MDSLVDQYSAKHNNVDAELHWVPAHIGIEANEQWDTKAFGDHVLAEILPLLQRCLSVTELNHAQIQRILTTSFSSNSSEIPRNYDDPKPIVRVRLDLIQDRQRIKDMSPIELGKKSTACGGMWENITAVRHDGEGQNGRILNIYATTWDVQKEMLARQAEIISILGVSNDCTVVNREYLFVVNKKVQQQWTQERRDCDKGRTLYTLTPRPNKSVLPLHEEFPKKLSAIAVQLRTAKIGLRSEGVSKQLKAGRKPHVLVHARGL